MWEDIPRRKPTAVEQQGTQVHTVLVSPRCVKCGLEVGWELMLLRRGEDQAKEWRLDAVSMLWMLIYQFPVARK